MMARPSLNSDRLTIVITDLVTSVNSILARCYCEAIINQQIYVFTPIFIYLQRQRRIRCHMQSYFTPLPHRSELAGLVIL